MIKRSKHYRSSRGFTLLEILIAMVILAVGLMASAKFQSNMIRSNTIAKQRTEATVLAQNAIENFRSQVTDINPAENIQSGSDDFQSDSTLFTRTWNSTKIKDQNGINTGDVEIKMTVSWPDISKVNDQGVAQVTEQTTVYLSSILSNQSFSDSAVRLKTKNSPPLEISGLPSSGGSSSSSGGSGSSSGGSGSSSGGSSSSSSGGSGSSSGGSGSSSSGGSSSSSGSSGGCSGGGGMMGGGGGMMGGGCGGSMMMGGK